MSTEIVPKSQISPDKGETFYQNSKWKRLLLRWLEGVWIFPSLIFYCGYTNNVEVKLLVQLCKGFTNGQISVAMTSKFIAMATSYEVNDALFFTV